MDIENDNSQLKLWATPEQFGFVSRQLKACEGLTSRQRAVFDLVTHGHSTKAIASRLQLSPGTVKVHLAACYNRCGVPNRTTLAILGTVARFVGPHYSVMHARAGDYQARL